jgi:hypothetical protein
VLAKFRFWPTLRPISKNIHAFFGPGPMRDVYLDFRLPWPAKIAARILTLGNVGHLKITSPSHGMPNFHHTYLDVVHTNFSPHFHACKILYKLHVTYNQARISLRAGGAAALKSTSIITSKLSIRMKNYDKFFQFYHHVLSSTFFVPKFGTSKSCVCFTN